VAVEVGVEVAEEGAAMVAPRACHRHLPVDAEDVVDGAQASIVVSFAFSLSPSTPEPKPIDGF
jgi:hypothetical protein